MTTAGAVTLCEHDAVDHAIGSGWYWRNRRGIHIAEWTGKPDLTPGWHRLPRIYGLEGFDFIELSGLRGYSGLYAWILDHRVRYIGKAHEFRSRMWKRWIMCIGDQIVVFSPTPARFYNWFEFAYCICPPLEAARRERALIERLRPEINIVWTRGRSRPR